MATHIDVNYYTFSPDTVSAYLAANDWPGCWDYLTQALKSFSTVLNPGLNIMLQKDMEDEEQNRKLSQFGSLLGELFFALLSDPSVRIPDKNFFSLIMFHEVLHNLFALYGITATNQVVEQILSGSKVIPDGQQKRMALLLSLRGQVDIVAALKRMDTKYRAPSYTAYIGYQSIYDRNVYENKTKLYALRHDLEKIYNDFETLTVALGAYFNCSYLDIPDRHILKESINKAVQHFLRDFQNQKDFKKFLIQNPVSPIAKTSTKPRMVIVMELLKKEHAMTRSWGAWIQSLQSEFETIIITNKARFDTEIQGVYGHVECYANLAEFLILLRAYAPDALVIPSVGMDFYGIVAANLRMAPLQIMGLGHPATSMSKYVDFVYGPRQMYSPEAFPHDHYIMDNAPYRFVANLPKDDFMAIPVNRRTANATTPLKVAVVGSPVKISAPFLDLLEQLQNEADFDIHFSFHLGSVGLDTLCFSQTLKERYRNVSYTGYKSYREYLAALGDADIVLNPFPFGHTNTLIDTMLLGIPCLGLQGAEPASKTEAYILDILGYEDAFSAHTVQDYKDKFFKMSQKIMAGEMPIIDRSAVYDTLYSHHQSYDFGKVIKWVYDNRERLLVSDKKAFEAFSP